MRAEDEPITLKKKACRLVFRRPSVMIERGQEIRRHSSESEQIRILLDLQREQILADCQAEFRNTNSRPIMNEKVFKS